MKCPALLVVLLFFSFQTTQANWQHSITNYTRQTYKAANQNWMIDQHENGWMYFANNKGLLEFDGVNWNTYSIHNAKMRAVKQGKDGRIYVGGLGQFGYFTPNNLGGLDYTCLSDSLETKRSTANIWNIHILDDRVYFQGDLAVYCLEGDALKRIECPEGITYSAIIHNKFYTSLWNGISFLNGDSFNQIPNSRHYTRSKTVGMYPYGNDLLIITAFDGMFLYDGINISPFHSAADTFLEKNPLFCSALNGSWLALGTVKDGVLLLNTQNGETCKISIRNGLQNKTVLSMYFDRDNNLWLGLDNGIDCIHLNTPVFSLLSNNSPIGAGYTSLLYKEKLYLGTNQGLYETDYPIKLSEDTRLDLILGSEGQVWSLLEYDNTLFCGGVNTLVAYDGVQSYQIGGIRGVWNLSPLKQYPGHIIAGTYTGVYVLKKEGEKWKISHRIDNAHYPAKNMYVEEITNAIWFSNKEGGLFRLKLNEDLISGRVKNYNSDFLPTGHNTYITKVNGEIIIASRQGLLRYNQVKDILERHETLESMLDGCVPYTYIKQDTQNNIWFVSNGILKRMNGELYLQDYLIEDFEHVAVYGQKDVLIGTEEGYCLLDLSHTGGKKHHMNLQVRKVYLTRRKDSLVYGRSFQHKDTLLVIPYRHNSIRFEYSLNNYSKQFVTRYSYKLEGSAYSEWSGMSENSTKEYTNLPEGIYSFHVKASMGEDMEEITTTLDFEVLPPWYKSWYAYCCYVFVVLWLIVYLYRKFIVGHRKSIREKEIAITLKMEEKSKNDEKAFSLIEKNLQLELKQKSDELIRSTLNILRKNEMLQNIKKEAISLSRSINDENLPNIRRKVIRLINSVDTNLEHDEDLLVFQTTFDSVHHDFFDKLDKQFPELNKREKLLCAYIRMDLMSKEIAPLMNISLRGVEISRYRLRKKFQLEQEDNLAEFLKQLTIDNFHYIK